MTKFDDYFKQRDAEVASAVAGNVAAPLGAPDDVAQARATGKEMGVPTLDVMVNPKVYKEMLAQKRAQRILAESPKTANFVGNAENAALAADDLEEIGWFETVANSLTRGTAAAPLTVDAGIANYNQGIHDDKSKSFSELLWDEREPIRGAEGQELDRVWPGPVDYLSAGWRWYNAGANEVLGVDNEAVAAEYLQAAAGWQDYIGNLKMSRRASLVRDQIGGFEPTGSLTGDLQAFGGIIANDPGGFVSFLAQVAGESLPNMVAGGVATGVAGATAGAAVMGTLSGAQEAARTFVEELEGREGKGPAKYDLKTPEGALAALADGELLEEARTKGGLRGLIIGALDGLSGGLAGQALSKSAMGNTVLQMLGQATLGGSGEALAQYVTEGWVNIAEVLVEAMAEFVGAPIEVATVGGGMISRARRRAQEAGRTSQELKDITDHANRSKLRERAPDKFLEALNEQGLGDAEIFIPADKMREYFQGAGLPDDIDAEILAAWGIIPEEWEVALATGGDVAVPVSNYAANLSGDSAAAKFVMSNGSLNPDREMSEAEAAEFASQDWAQIMELELQNLEQRAQQDAAFSDASERVHGIVYDNLRNRFGADTADAYATLIARRMTEAAAEMGTDALSFWGGLDIQINSGGRVSGETRRRNRDDAVINQIRDRGMQATPSRDEYVAQMEKDAVAAFPELKAKRPFTSKIAARGGIAPGSPAARELAQVGVTTRTAPGLFRKGGMTDVDNLPYGEFFASPVLEEDGNGYISRDAVIDALFREAKGEKIAGSAEAMAALEAIGEAARGEDWASGQSYAYGFEPGSEAATLAALVDEAGIDLSAMTNDQIAEALGIAEMRGEDFASGENTEGEGEVYNQPQAGQMYAQDGSLNTESEAFKKWFGDSKVVDADGKPLVVYHGTDSDVEAFDNKFRGRSTQATSSIAGFFFTNDERTARSYADYAATDAQVTRLVAEADKAGEKGDWDTYDAKTIEAEELDASMGGPEGRLRGQNIMPVYLSIKNPLVVDAGGETPDGIGGIDPIIKKAKRLGHDGVIIRNFDDAAGLSDQVADHYIAFNPTQIKSVFNRGTWDAGDARILYQGAIENDHPFQNFTREQFLGKPKITTDSNSSTLVPKVLPAVEGQEAVPFSAGKGLTAKYHEYGAAVFDGDKVIASYNFGDTLVVDKKYRRKGIAAELVYQWRMRNPNEKTATNRTKKSQALQEKVWDRIEREMSGPLLFQGGPEISAEAKAKALSSHRAQRGVKLGAKAKVYRGVSSESGNGMASYGQGLYTTASKKMAKQYAGDDGQVLEMDRYDDLPGNPLRFDTINDYEIWLQQAEKAAGYAGLRERQEAGFVEPDHFIRAIDPEVDGLQIGKGADAFFVKWPETGRTLNQGKKPDPLGSLALPAGGLGNGRTMLNLFEEANLSTFLHEAGHLFLEVDLMIARSGKATPDFMRRHGALREWLGMKEGDQTPTRAQHEKFARGFEAYLMEGNAPSVELAGAFASFRRWLRTLYQQLSALRVRLTPEVRAVMDRMLASQDAIDEARRVDTVQPLFDQAPPGMSQQDWETYLNLAQREKDQAETNLLKKTMERIRKERTKQMKEARASITKEVTAEFSKRKNFRLVSVLGNGKWLSESKATVPELQMDRAAVQAQMGPGIFEELNNKRLGARRSLFKRGGVAPEVVADMFGYPSVAAMFEELQNTPRLRDAIKAEVDRRIDAEFGDVLTDGSLQAEAELALRNSVASGRQVRELKAINAMRGGNRGPDPKIEKLRRAARWMLGNMSTKQASNPEAFLRAERKAAREAQEAFAAVVRGGAKAADAIERAYKAKERQILSQMLYRESRDFRDQMKRGRERFRGYESGRVRAAIGSPHIERIDDLLATYDFRQRSEKWVSNREALRVYMDEMIADGREHELAIDPLVMAQANTKHYSRMSVDEFRGLLDTVRNIEDIGRRTGKLRDRQRERDLNATLDEVRAEMAANLKRYSVSRGGPTKREKRRTTFKETMNWVLNADTHLRGIGGGKMGKAWWAIKAGIDRGMGRYEERKVDAAKMLDEVFGVYSMAERRAMSESFHVPELGQSLSKWNLIVMALNSGNAMNWERLTNVGNNGAKGFNASQVDAALAAHLDQRDWDFAQSLIDSIGSYWPEIAAKEKRQKGVVPAKVEAEVMTSAAPASFTGGYFPIAYDPRLSARASDLSINEAFDALKAGRAGSAQTKNGHTKERKRTSGMPIDLNIEHVFTHVDQVIRDLELAEEVANSWAIVSRLKQDFQEMGHQEDYQALEYWLKDTAAGDGAAVHGWDKVLRYGRTGFTISRLALNATTVALQPTGIAQSLVVVGKRAMMRGMMAYMRNPGEVAKGIRERSPMMRERWKAMERDIHTVAGELNTSTATGGRWERFQRNWLVPASMAAMAKVQYYTVDAPTWQAGYLDALQQGMGDADASTYADAMVKRAQGSGLISDRGMMERGRTNSTARSEMPKLFTALGSYMFAKFNVAYERIAGTNFRDPREWFSLAGDMVLLFALEAVLAAVIRGNLPEEEEEWPLWLAKETTLSAMGTVPFVRDAASMFQGFDGGGAQASVFDLGVVRPMTAVGEALFAEDGEVDRKFVTSLIDAAGIWTHAPSSQINRIIKEMFEPDMTMKDGINPFDVAFGGGQGRSLIDLIEGE